MAMQEISFDEALDLALTERQIKIAAGLTVEPNRQRRDIEQGMLEVFELIGGVPRLAIWANNPKNYGRFLQLLAKLLPKEIPEDIARQIIYQSTVPASPLSDPTRAGKRPAIDEQAEDAQLIEDKSDDQPER